ncbi:hypothetical protein QAD02_011700 [Eretmocerus hayati]|uniref:Uncharacterized protein n=1 Tax=Eretmocerus hayati TaxID=131215 RepID=A0ACC2NXW1_9HYME|nr:hypothetical protein QAD02_011700 [Eretmocerus hayati]
MILKCGHGSNRLKVCAPCGGKVTLRKYISKIQITNTVENLIQKFMNPDFSRSDPNFPLCICTSCRKALYEKERNICGRQLPTMPNYKDMILDEETVGDDNCNCYICLTARSTHHPTIGKGRGEKRDLNKNQIDESNGLIGSSKFTLSLPINSSNESKTVEAMTICIECFQGIGKGIQHGNGSCANNSPINLINLLEMLSDKDQEQIVAAVLREMAANMYGSVSAGSSLELCNPRGKPVRVTINPVTRKNIIFSVEILINFHVTTGAPKNYMRKMSSSLRSVAGRKTVPCRIEEQITLQSRKLEEIHHSGYYEFEISNGKKELRLVI